MIEDERRRRWRLVLGAEPAAALDVSLSVEDARMDEALEAGAIIAAMSPPSVMMIKEAVNRAYESSLSEGIHFERRLFHSTFATEDQKEGMKAFIEKRLPSFRGL